MPPRSQAKARVITLVQKVPIPPDEKPVDTVASFTDFPIMYLELLENKFKIKKECRDTDYAPAAVQIDNKLMPQEAAVPGTGRGNDDDDSGSDDESGSESNDADDEDRSGSDVGSSENIEKTASKQQKIRGGNKPNSKHPPKQKTSQHTFNIKQNTSKKRNTSKHGISWRALLRLPLFRAQNRNPKFGAS